MSPFAHLRLGSLEILGALALFVLVAARLRPESLTASPAPRRLAVQLRVRESPGLSSTVREVTVRLGESMPDAVLGRSSLAQVELLDPEVSRRHARLEFTRGVVYLSDLGSSNGTFLNGKRLKHEGIEVRPGDDIDVGNTRLTVLGTEPLEWT